MTDGVLLTHQNIKSFTLERLTLLLASVTVCDSYRTTASNLKPNHSCFYRQLVKFSIIYYEAFIFLTELMHAI